MAVATNLSHRKIEKLLTKSIKHVLSDSDIKTGTRSGNKELGILVKQIAIAPFDSAAAVEKVGTALGEKIATLSKANNKQDLDAGTIRTLSLKKDWIAEFDIPEVAPTEKVSKKASKSAQTVIVEPKKQAEPAPTELESSEPEPAEAVAEAEVGEAAAAEETPEAAVPEEATDISEAAEAEVVETVADAAGEGASTAAPADPEAVAMVNEAETEEE
ncbi:MAG: hypothetical protein AAFQ40_06525 [Cyanobacteria bacterium J06623_5]